MAIDIKRNYNANFTDDERVLKQRARVELEKQMAEFLAKGGAVERLEPGIATSSKGTKWTYRI
jgi:hypothetical protein